MRLPLENPPAVKAEKIADLHEELAVIVDETIAA
jgi:hypothetical protein